MKDRARWRRLSPWILAIASFVYVVQDALGHSTQEWERQEVPVKKSLGSRPWVRFLETAIPAVIPSLSPRRGRFDATITRHDAYSFGVARQGTALRRRFLQDRQRAIVEYGYQHRPRTVQVLTPIGWEQGLTVSTA